MSFQIEFTKKAKEDLNEIYSYIAFTLLSPDVAKEMYYSIIKGIQSLDELPLRNAVMNDEPWKSLGLRKCFIKNYTAFYLVDETNPRVRIVRIMYSGRDIQKQLSETEER